MKEKWKHIFEPDHCPSIEDLRNYLEGKLSGEPLISLENHLSDCSLCQDVLDGLQLIQSHGSLDKVESELQQRVDHLLSIDQKHPSFTIMYRRIAVAASIALLLGTGFWFIKQHEHKGQHLTQMSALSKPVVKKSNDRPVDSINRSVAMNQVLNKSHNYNLKRLKRAPKPETKQGIDSGKLSEKLLSVETPQLISTEAITRTSSDDEINVVSSVAPSLSKVKEKSYASHKIISGIVRDLTTNEPISGANVIIKGTTSGALTDANGRYTIKVQDTTAVLVFSFIGYKTEEKTVGKENTIEIAMNTQSQSLQEVVVIGYGAQKKSSVTGSVVAAQANNFNIRKTRSACIKQARKYLENKWTDKAISVLDSLKKMTSDTVEINKMNDIILLIGNGEFKLAENKLKKVY